MKRIIAIHDISGVGKCSLTAAMPIISAAGVECNPLPTAILSTHTGGIEGYTFKDLTDNILPSFMHWKNLELKFDGLYSGYLGSIRQVDIVEKIIDSLPDSLIVVDPAMADSGKMYVGFDNEFVNEMKSLCQKADIIVPNITEGCFLTGTEYSEDFDYEEIKKLIVKLGQFTKRYVVLTGTSIEGNSTGASVYDKKSGKLETYSSPKYDGIYYGTGDIFASALTASVIRGIDCFEASKIALEFTRRSIEETHNAHTDPRFGVAFENHLKYITEKMEELS